MGRGDNKIDQAAKDFIAGRTNSARIAPSRKQALGYSPTQATASGAGTHGGGKRRRNRKDRQSSRKRIRGGDWD